MTRFNGFPKDTFKFLNELGENNNREWFQDNKWRYEQSVLQPALDLIAALEKPLAKVAPLLRVEPKRVGGSLMRIYKDTRFAKDKTPYKTNIGIHFRHRSGADVHAPGAYLHIACDESFFGVGMWRPPSEALKLIRNFIGENPESWRKAMNSKRFRDAFTIRDDRLKTVPRGYDKGHPLIDQLRQKSFIATTALTRQQIQSQTLLTTIPKLVAAGSPWMVALCGALDQPY